MKEKTYSGGDDKAHRVAYLIAGYIRDTLTEKEHEELDAWVNERDHNMQLFEDLTEEKNLAANLAWMDQVQTEQSYQTLQQQGAFNIRPRKVFNRRTWLAAASLVLLLTVFVIGRYVGKRHGNELQLAAAVSTILKPGSSRARLRLGDGKIVDLSDATTGVIENNEGVHVDKTGDGSIEYGTDNSAGTSASLHTLSTPVGGQYRLSLPDGSKVWLNSASSIQYPTVFNAGERIVSVTGEVYFEVAKHQQQPFKVLLEDSTSVVVTGTHFNVNAYEKQKQVALLEGSVSVFHAGSNVKLEPGTEALLQNDHLTKATVPDIETVTGWKDGLFVFHDAPITEIMMQLARWYDAKIIYKTNTQQLFNASISRKEPLAKVLSLLELNGYVHFKTENNIIYVLP